MFYKFIVLISIPIIASCSNDSGVDRDNIIKGELRGKSSGNQNVENNDTNKDSGKNIGLGTDRDKNSNSDADVNVDINVDIDADLDVNLDINVDTNTDVDINVDVNVNKDPAPNTGGEDSSDDDSLEIVPLPDEERDAMKLLLPNAASFQKIGDSNGDYIMAKSDANEALAYGFIAENTGYNDVIRTLTAIDKDGKSVGVEVLYQQETPYFWSKLNADFFQQLIGIPVNSVTLDPVYDRNCNYQTAPCTDLYKRFTENQIDAATGATVSSDAVVKDFIDAYYQYDKLEL